MSHLSPGQVELLDQYDRGEWSDADFKALALDEGLSHARIQQAIKDRQEADRIAAEDRRDAMWSNGQIGAWA